ncbi:MAG: hypothetical protein V9F05_12750 [Chitinophagaceae bacterium]
MEFQLTVNKNPKACNSLQADQLLFVQVDRVTLSVTPVAGGMYQWYPGTQVPIAGETGLTLCGNNIRQF